MRQFLTLVTLAAALLAGCSSGVKLNEVPVEDKGVMDSKNAGYNTVAAPVAPPALASSTGIGPVGVSHVILFDYDSYTVKADARPLLEQHARFLQANKQRKLALEGHTDERGGAEYNLALAQKRAESVQRVLGLLGVPDGQMEAVSYGKEKPSVVGGDEGAHAKNRRVELKY